MTYIVPALTVPSGLISRYSDESVAVKNFVATKFFTATLSSLYREISPDGTVNAGTMYVIKNGLPKYMLPFAYMFAFFGMIAGLPAVQASEIVRITESLFFSDVENFAYIAI